MRQLSTCTFILFITFNSFGQSDSVNDKFFNGTLTEVVELDSISKSEIYNRAKMWFATSFQSSKDVIQLDDKEIGKIVGKGVINYEAPAFNPGAVFTGYFEFVVIIDIKDNKYRYSIETIRHESNKSGFSGGLFDSDTPAC